MSLSLGLPVFYGWNEVMQFFFFLGRNTIKWCCATFVQHLSQCNISDMSLCLVGDIDLGHLVKAQSTAHLRCKLPVFPSAVKKYLGGRYFVTIQVLILLRLAPTNFSMDLVCNSCTGHLPNSDFACLFLLLHLLVEILLKEPFLLPITYIFDYLLKSTWTHEFLFHSAD